MNGNQTLLKQDVRGRVRTPAARREALLDEFERSAVSGAKFAALVGVKYQTFASWVCHRKNKRVTLGKSRGAALALRARSSLRVVEAVLDPEAKLRDEAPLRMDSALNVHLAGGIRLEIGDAGHLKLALSLIKALALEGSC